MSTQDFDGFAEREYPRLLGALTLYCGDGLLAEELAQDTLVRVRERWRRVGQMDRPGGYAHRVAINLAKSRFRRRAAERRALARVAAGDGAVPLHLDPCGADGHAVRVAVAALPPRQREVLVRRYYLGQSSHEVAESMSISVGTVASATSRAVASLREEFDVNDPLREVTDVA